MIYSENEKARRVVPDGKRIGLALGGGVVRGLAHVGVLEVLEKAGIPIDFVSGTSAGAIMAACVAAGIDARRIKEFAWTFTWPRLMRPVWPKRGLVSFDRMRRFLNRYLGELMIEDLSLPLVIATTDIERGEPVYLREGPLALAVQASCSVPGFVTPVEWQGRWLAEGAMSNMVPVSILREMGADYVIGVDIFAHKVRHWLGPLGYLMGGVEILLERSGLGLVQADCCITPALSGKTYLRFSRRDELFELGRQAALLQLPAITRDLGIDDEARVGQEAATADLTHSI